MLVFFQKWRRLLVLYFDTPNFIDQENEGFLRSDFYFGYVSPPMSTRLTSLGRFRWPNLVWLRTGETYKLVPSIIINKQINSIKLKQKTMNVWIECIWILVWRRSLKYGEIGRLFVGMFCEWENHGYIVRYKYNSPLQLLKRDPKHGQPDIKVNIFTRIVGRKG